ncbi:MAG: YbfB/YjiJ family MFS transporter [Pseudomonadota bacterium]|nr:YbfB/YjiJ family MFS transporter [Pseudomonadota bacterium]
MPVWFKIAIGGHMALLVGMGLGRFSYTPMVPALTGAGVLSAPEAGAVGAVNLGAYVVGGLASGWLARRFRPARVLQVCLALAALALLACMVPGGFWWLAWWRGLIGAAVAVMMICGIALVANAAPPGRLGLATAIAFTGVGVGIFLSAIGLPWLLARGLIWAWAGAAAVGLVAAAIGLWAWRAALPLSLTPPAGAATDGDGGAGRRLVLAQALFSLGLVPHSIYWVDFLVAARDWPLQAAGQQWALFGLGALGGTVLWGMLADRLGFGRALVLVFVSLSAGIALPFVWSAPAAAILSILVVGAQPGFSAIVAGRARLAVGPAAMIVLWRWMVVAVGAAQMIGGAGLVWLFTLTGSYVAVFAVGAAAMAAGVVTVAGLPRDRPAVAAGEDC